MLKCTIKSFCPLIIIQQNSFVYLCTYTMNARHSVFSVKHAIPDMKNISQFQDISRIFPRIRRGTDRWTDIRSDR